MGCEKSKHRTWILRHFSQVLDSLGEFGIPPIPTLTDTELEVLTAFPQRPDGGAALLAGCGEGDSKRARGRESCEHMKYREGFLTAHLAVVKLLVFNCACCFILHKKPRE